MRVKSFRAASVNDAMKQIRDTLGDDAVIISTTRIAGGKGVEVTAAVEQDDEDALSSAADHLEDDGVRPSISTIGERTAQAMDEAIAKQDNAAKREALRSIAKILQYHNCPAYLARQLLQYAESAPVDKPGQLLLHLLRQAFDFEPLELAPNLPPVMLIGAPGVGKTMTVAKILTQCRQQNMPVSAITTDGHKAGGIEQLKAFTDILDIDLHLATSPETLQETIRKIGRKKAVIIDSPGYNPYEADELSFLGKMIGCEDIEPVLVCHAGMDGMDAADLASNFAYLGVRRLIISKVDTARRYGGLLTAAHAGNFAFSHFSRHAGAAEGLQPISPDALAAMLIHRNLHDERT